MKKITSDQIEIVDSKGTHIAGKEEAPSNPFNMAGMNGGMHVVKMGSLGGIGTLLMLPILIPVAIIGFFLVAILALFFGKAFLKTGMTKVLRR